MIIDANMYWLPETIFDDESLAARFLAAIPADSPIYGHEKTLEAGQPRQIVIEKPKGYPNLNYVQGDYFLEKQLADMDAAGVEKAPGAVLADGRGQVVHQLGQDAAGLANALLIPSK